MPPAYCRAIVDKDPGPKLPKPRAGADRTRNRSVQRPEDNPARPYNRPPGAKLVDVPGLLIVLGLVVAGFLVAVLFIRASR